MLAVVLLCRPLYGYVSHCMGCCRLTNGVFKWQLCHSMLIMLIMLRCKFFFYHILTTRNLKFQDSEFRHNRWQVGCVRKFEYQWRQKQVLLLFRDMFEWFLTNFNIHGISFIQRWIFLLLFTQNQIRFRSPYHEFIKHLYPNDQIQFLLSSCLSISDLVVIFAHLWCCHKKMLSQHQICKEFWV